jgi:hypothetical protein
VVRAVHLKNMIQVLAHYPKLKLAGCVAGILTPFKHGDDYNLHLNRLVALCNEARVE